MNAALELVVQPLEVHPRSHDPLPTLSNCALVLEAIGDCIRFEAFSGKIICAGLTECGFFPDGEWTDEHTTSLVKLCESQKLYVSPSTVDRAVAAHAHARAYNVLTDFLNECASAWDGKGRVDWAMTTYWGAPNDEASRAVARVFLLSLAARGLEPGRKVDTCPVLIGTQGGYKSTSLETLVGPAWFSDSPLPIGEKDGMQNLAGVWLWEFSENESLSKKERNAVKAFLSSKRDKFRASYAHHAKTLPRQTCFAASTNEPEVLTDPTGARRFLPVRVGVIDLKALQRDRLQLLGEAAQRVAQGEQWWPTKEEARALAPAHEAATELDPWHEPIAQWARAQQAPFAIDEVFALVIKAGSKLPDPEKSGPVPIAVESRDKRAQARASAVLRTLGYERRRERSGPRRDTWLWSCVGPGAQVGPSSKV